MLSNVNLRDALREGQIRIDGLQESAIQKASIDLHLGEWFIPPHIPWDDSFCFDMFDEGDTRRVWGSGKRYAPDGFLVNGKSLVLAATERVFLNNELVGEVKGKSSVARDGLIIESAGFIDPGFDGPITLEIYNQMPFPILLLPGAPIAQIAFSRLDTPADGEYNGKYINSQGPVASRYWQNERPQVIHKEGNV